MLDKYFDDRTMSIHLREGVVPFAKKGMPGNWTFEAISDKKLSADEIQMLSENIIQGCEQKSDAFIELQREGSVIIQYEKYRIVIVKPPLSDGWEITAVRPVKLLDLNEYKLSEKLLNRIKESAEGILVAGAPGEGKTTFARALGISYAEQNKIVKTVEAPRDMILPETITQLALSYGSPEEIHDILLLSRPDYTLFDEMRNTKDFELFADLRLSGVGMVGVIHATNPIDAIQRFIGRIDLGVIPQIIDTVIFIKGGRIAKLYEIQIRVKVPSGMTEADLARPVVEINDFETGRTEYEIYSYGDQTAVVPVTEQRKNATDAIAAKSIESELRKFSQSVKVEIASSDKCIAYIPKNEIGAIIGKQGNRITDLENLLGIKIEVVPTHTEEKVDYEIEDAKRYIQFHPKDNLRGKDLDVTVDEKYLLTAKVGSRNLIKVHKFSELGKELANAITLQKKIELKK